MFCYQEFETQPKFFEADAPTGSIVICEYVKMKKSLQDRIDTCTSRADPFFPMFHAMHQRVTLYLTEALKSNVLVLAAVLHLSYRTDYFQLEFGKDSDEYLIAQTLITDSYHRRKYKLDTDAGYKDLGERNGSNNGDDGDDDGDRAHKQKNRKKTENELRDYFEGANEPPLEVEKDPKLALQWWKVRILVHLSLSSLLIS